MILFVRNSILFLLTILSCMANLQAQAATAARLNGVLLDSLTKEPVAFAGIAIFANSNDKLVGGGISDDNGKFEVALQGSFGAAETFRVKIDFVGYRSKIINSVKLTANPQPLGTLYLSASSVELQSVEVRGDKTYLANSIDRKVYSASQLLSNPAGQAVDLLNNIPSVTIDGDGKVNFRGSEQVNIMIDGKPIELTGMNLEQIPAGAIESLEIISNPSAKYNPEGSAGIINLILKKNTKKGNNASLMLGVGTNDKYNAAATWGIMRKKINFFGNYGFRYDERYNRSTLDREIFQDDYFKYTQRGDGSNTNQSHLLKIGIDYNLFKQTTLSASAIYNGSKGNNQSSAHYTLLNEEQIKQDEFVRDNTSTDPYNAAWITALGLRHQGKDKKNSLTIDLTRSVTPSQNNTQFSIYHTPITADDYAQRNYTDNNNIANIAQIDYMQRIGESNTLESGFRFSQRDFSSMFRSEIADYTENIYVENDALTNDFSYNEYVYAAYANYAFLLKKILIKAGVRGEQTDISVDKKTADTLLTTTDDYFSLFPTLNVSYPLDAQKNIQINYSRRINRPSVGTLNPIIDVNDPYSQRLGNPSLKPEYINSFDAGLQMYLGDFSWNNSFYWRNTEQAVARIIEIDTNGVLKVLPINVNNANSYGIESIVNGSIKKWFNFTLSANAFRNELDVSNINDTLSNAAWNLSTKLMTNFRLPKDYDVQLTGSYSTPRNTPQGKFYGFNSFDITVRKKLWRGKANIAMGVSDIFDKQQFRVKMDDSYFTSYVVRKRETRIFTVNFTYYFGKPQEGGSKKDKPQQRPEGGEGMDMF